MALLLGDEDFPRPVVEGLRQLGHDVVAARDRGLTGRGVPDADILAAATAEGRAVLTRNGWDYIRLDRQSQEHAGIVVCSDDPDFPGQAARIHAAVTAAGDLSGQLIRVNRPARQP